jgi:hypothetical protein
MYDAACMHTEIAKSPKDYQHNGYDIKEITHGNYFLE